MRSPIARWGWFVLGWLMVALGIIGYVTPIMPGTVFLILAAGCFSHSSPRFEKWLLDHRWFGPPIRNWRASGAIPTKAKWLALASMAGGYGIMWFTVHPAPWLAALVAIFLLACAAYVATRPSM